jgi:hypothetical protein
VLHALLISSFLMLSDQVVFGEEYNYEVPQYVVLRVLVY